MSYKTNPIINRIKINKGWKNPYLPTKTLNYSRDISLWFKVYLLLKFFLNLKKIQLVSFEIRFDQKNKKIIYLRINKKGEQKKKRKKKKLALNKILKKIQTPMLKSRNTGAIFFLYKDVFALKKLAFWNKNVIQKKALTKFWLTKPKISTWLNTLEKITLIRQKTKKNLQYAKKSKNFLPASYLKLKFSINRQKQLLTQIAKLKKKNLLLSIQFFALLSQQKVLRRFTQNLKKEILRNKIQIQKISKVYNFLLFSLKKNSLKNQLKKKFFQKKIINSIQRQKLNLLWKVLKKQLHSLNRVRFIKKELPVLLLNANTRLDKPLEKYKWKFLKKNTLLKKILHLNFLVAQMSNNAFLLRNSFLWNRFYLKSKLHMKTSKQATLLEKNLFTSSFFKTNLNKNKKRNLRKKQLSAKLYYNISLWIALRKVKKRKIKGLHSRLFRRKFKNFQKKLYTKRKLQSYKKYNNFLAKNKFFRKKKQKAISQQIKKINWSLKSYRVAKYYQYRLPYRKMHFSFKQFETSLKLKYLIQDFVQKYFSVQVETKILHVLNAQKNMNFFRLIFSARKKKHNLLVKKRRLDTWNQKQIFLSSRLQFLTSAKKKKRKVKKLNSKRIPLKTILTKKNAIKALGKKTLFLLSEKKRLKWRLKNYFSRIKQGKEFRSVFKYLMPTLIDFSRSLDPQLLANVLAKVIKTSKKQTWMLNTIKSILQSLQLPKNVGYKILLSGRINSKKKSRSIYIAQKQIALQVFSNNMNFAYAQANARIGAFGVKIWIYSKKN